MMVSFLLKYSLWTLTGFILLILNFVVLQWLKRRAAQIGQQNRLWSSILISFERCEFLIIILSWRFVIEYHHVIINGYCYGNLSRKISYWGFNHFLNPPIISKDTIKSWNSGETKTAGAWPQSYCYLQSTADYNQEKPTNGQRKV